MPGPTIPLRRRPPTDRYRAGADGDRMVPGRPTSRARWFKALKHAWADGAGMEDQSMTTAKDVAIAATTEIFGKKDPSAVDRWVSPDYVQHSALAGDGPAAMRELVASLGPDFDYKPTR